MEDNLPEKVTVNRYDDCLLLPPGAANNRQNEMYKVFTPFKRTFLERLESADTGCLPQPGPASSFSTDQGGFSAIFSL